MSFVRLSDRRQIDPLDLEAEFGELVRLVGGSRYIGGSPLREFGVLDARNFSENAGFRNDQKAKNASYHILQIYRPIYTSTSPVWPTIGVPPTLLGIEPEYNATVIAWNLVAGGVSNPVNAGNTTLTHFYGFSNTPITGGGAFTNAASGVTIVNQIGLSIPIQPNGSFLLTFSISTASITVTDLICTITIRMEHVR